MMNGHAPFARVLVLAPHTDDGEFGCGGSIGRFLEQGSEVHYAAFSLCEKSVPEEYPPDILRSELEKATCVLGIPQGNVHVFNYEVRKLPQFRQEVLENLIELRRTLSPDLVLLPSTFDIHQDHATIAQEGLRAFKDRTMLGYEVPWNNITFKTQAFITLEERHLDKKVAALKCYQSQQGKPYASEEFLRSLVRTRGTLIGTRYAEAFEVMRWVLGSNGTQ
jgi:LmbE family N-acetylglucosaminyl deacetylase